MNRPASIRRGNLGPLYYAGFFGWWKGNLGELRIGDCGLRNGRVLPLQSAFCSGTVPRELA
ncbi:MAG TPA: hypothetical protein VMP01_16250 [Pirellulaceae bacterium]|nr:hypothetical protein [Pirellulaceae bacterium]